MTVFNSLIWTLVTFIHMEEWIGNIFTVPINFYIDNTYKIAIQLLEELLFSH